MKRLFLMTFTAYLLFAASACSSELDPGNEDFDLDGEIIQIEESGEEHLRILVEYAASPPSDGTARAWLVLNDETELLKQQGRSIQRVGSETLRVGQEVRAWTSDVWLYSNPPQAGAKRLLIDTILDVMPRS